MAPICFHVPGVPVAKGRPRIGTINGKARAFTPKKTVNYESLVALAGETAMAGTPPMDGAIRLDVVAVFPIAASWSKAKRAQAEAGALWHVSRPDGDNILKAIGDGLNGVCWTDDSRIASGRIDKRYGRVPGVSVTVTAL